MEHHVQRRRWPTAITTITATAIDQFGETTVTTPASPVVIDSNLDIDTVGPVVNGMFFNRLNGQVDYIISDPVPPTAAPRPASGSTRCSTRQTTS